MKAIILIHVFFLSWSSGYLSFLWYKMFLVLICLVLEEMDVFILSSVRISHQNLPQNFDALCLSLPSELVTPKYNFQFFPNSLPLVAACGYAWAFVLFVFRHSSQIKCYSCFWDASAASRMPQEPWPGAKMCQLYVGCLSPT